MNFQHFLDAGSEATCIIKYFFERKKLVLSLSAKTQCIHGRVIKKALTSQFPFCFLEMKFRINVSDEKD